MDATQIAKFIKIDVKQNPTINKQQLLEKYNIGHHNYKDVMAILKKNQVDLNKSVIYYTYPTCMKFYSNETSFDRPWIVRDNILFINPDMVKGSLSKNSIAINTDFLKSVYEDELLVKHELQELNYSNSNPKALTNLVKSFKIVADSYPTPRVKNHLIINGIVFIKQGLYTIKNY